MTLKAIIAEDEANIRTGLKLMLKRLWPELQICAEAQNGKEALALIEREKPDVVFLDIQMPELTGLEVGERVSAKTKVVFVTAYDHYAVQAFESEAIDYVLKPVTEERLSKTLARLKQQLTENHDPSHLDFKIKKIAQLLEKKEASEKLKIIKVKRGSELHILPISQIYYFKAENKYTTVQTIQNEFIIKTSIRELEEKLDPEQFWRVHRSAIVNIEKIDKIKRTFTNRMVITFAKINQTVAVSKTYEHLFQHM